MRRENFRGQKFTKSKSVQGDLVVLVLLSYLSQSKPKEVVHDAEGSCSTLQKSDQGKEVVHDAEGSCGPCSVIKSKSVQGKEVVHDAEGSCYLLCRSQNQGQEVVHNAEGSKSLFCCSSLSLDFCQTKSKVWTSSILHGRQVM